MKNKKGFTLIELLAVIVILGVLLAIAVPSVSKYISTSKKSTYIDNAQTYGSTARDQANLGTFKLPVNKDEATVVYFNKLKESLDKGGKTSPYGAEYEDTKSFVVIANTGTAEDPVYTIYITAIDKNGYGIGVNPASGSPSGAIIAYDDLSTGNILQLTTAGGVTGPTAKWTSGTLNATNSVTVNGGKQYKVTEIYKVS